MSDQEKNLKDEELDKVSGGGKVTDPIIRTPVSSPIDREREVRNPAYGHHETDPP